MFIIEKICLQALEKERLELSIFDYKFLEVLLDYRSNSIVIYYFNADDHI